MQPKTLIDWFKQQYRDDTLQTALDMSTHGCSGGFNGLITYVENALIYDQYQDEIWDLIASRADEVGETPLQFIANFYGANHVNSDYSLKTCLVWFALEETAHTIINDNGA